MAGQASKAQRSNCQTPDAQTISQFNGDTVICALTALAPARRTVQFASSTCFFCRLAAAGWLGDRKAGHEPESESSPPVLAATAAAAGAAVLPLEREPPDPAGAALPLVKLAARRRMLKRWFKRWSP